ncbi:Coiled-coil domain-containing protein 58 [Geodia barretti]|uniref:Protein MIX23 n=1 Tax=Geodia barretti TaxID=519541 RepID=A0AA35XC05_GEOBA|nr:Coiled-coil domain-containing protein 58 [Geodia barretti]
MAELPCGEFSEFKEALQQLRALDDKIIYKLNTSVPTQSFAGLVSADERCKQLYEEMKAGYLARPAAIQHCIDRTSERVMELRTQREGAGGDDPATNKALRKEQTKLRLMQSELAVEDVIRERSTKVCR